MAKDAQSAKGTAGPSSRTYKINGLKTSDTMPISFDGRVFDLANLSDEDLTYLLKFPDEVPYLKS
jgi:hypothetical protein